MYIIPGYTYWQMDENNLLVSSYLYQNTLKITEPKLIQDFYQLTKEKGCWKLSSPFLVTLHDQGIIQTESEVLAALSKLKEYMSGELLLTIMPTEACNFRCPYCYEDHAPITMRPEIVDKIIEYVEKETHRCSHLNVSWFGGEPTLCKEIITKVMTRVRFSITDSSIKFDSNMTTNGYLLDLSTFNEYFKLGITNYQITLDGWNHDRLRPHVSGSSSLQVIVKNLTEIAALPKEKYNFHIVLRRNILAEDDNYSWYDYVNELFGNDSRFSISVVAITNWGGENIDKLNYPKIGKKRLLEKHWEYIDKIGLPRERSQLTPFSNVCYSSCERGLVFRANGKIEKCTIALDKPGNAIGYVSSEHGVIIDHEANKKWFISDILPKCYTCKDVLSCLNICCRKGIVIDGAQEGVCLCEQCSTGRR